MFDFFRKANRAVAKGNIYRKRKYGKPDTFAQSYEKARKWREWYKAECLPDTLPQWPSEHWDNYKAKFQYWDCWSGGRYERIENPNPHPDAKPNSVCRSCAVTGKWYPR